MDLRSAITFTGLAQAVIAYLSIFGWYYFSRVRSAVVRWPADLLKPLDYFRFWLALDLGRGWPSCCVGDDDVALCALFPDHRAHGTASMGGVDLRIWVELAVLVLPGVFWSTWRR